MNALLALWEKPIATWGWVEFLILIIVVAGALTVTWIILTQVFEWTPKPWMIKIFWVVVACFVGIFAIRLIAGM